MGSLIVPIVLLILILVFGIVFLVITGKQKSATEDKGSKTSKGSSKSTSAKNSDVPKEDVFKFMEFDKIVDDMIVQNKGQKYTMILKCKGINYDLMSENEQLAVEEGFITFLNTLKFPVQLYVQAQNIDLKKTISKYNEHLQNLVSEYDQVNQEYNQVINSLDSTKEEIRNADYNKKSVQNVLEYASDIVRYVERLSANKSLLQRSFYVIFSYYTSEITSISNFSKDEIQDICYNELYTRAASISGALSSCSVSSTLLKSNDLANLLYTSYNRDDAKYIDVERALESGFYRLYSTSEDAFTKKQNLLNEQIKNEAQIKAYEALKKAIQDGEYLTPEMQQIEVNQEIAKKAIDIVRNEDFEDSVKEQAKDIIVEDYKNTKREILDKTSAKAREIQGKTRNVDEKQNLSKEDTNVEGPKTIIDNSKILDSEIQPSIQTVNKFEEPSKVNNDEIIDKEPINSNNIVEPQIENIKNDMSINVSEEPKTTEVENDQNTIDKNDNAHINLNQDDDDNVEKNSNNNTNNDDDFEDDFFDSII